MQKIRLMALGGLDEDGKNMFVVEIDDAIYIVDAGLKYPNETEQLGIEYIIPDFTYLIENKERVKAIFITHGHDDVMMALPHLLKEIDLPVYATALTAKILQDLFKRHKIKKPVTIIKRRDTIKIGKQIVYTFPVMQSIADGVGISFDTEYGQIVFTSEFIVDYDFMNPAFMMDINAFFEMGQKGVLCLLSESAGASRVGYTSPRHRISDRIEPILEACEERIFITLYKQNLFRIIEVLDLAKRYDRRVMFYDDDQYRLLHYMEELGYYKVPRDLIIPRSDFNNADEDVICVISGSGNEVFKLMNKIAIGDDPYVELRSSDTVIIASPVVPGTEKEASNMENDLYKEVVSVIKIKAKEVLSMHASIEDLKMMLFMLKPKYYIPVKGDFSKLIANADIATSMGYKPDKIIVLDNGQFATFEDGRLVSTRDFIELSEQMIDGNDKLDVQGMVLKDRETLSTEGAIVVGVFLNFKTKEILGGPDVQSRGVIYLKDADYIVNQVGNILMNTIEEMVQNGTYDNIQTRMEAKERISRYILKETGKRPMILPAIGEINFKD